MAATILIVEDEYAVARGIEYALAQEGYTVTVARSGEEGLEFAVHQAPDLVVLDVRLPGMDGFEALRRLRASGAKMPVLVLTARDDEVDKVIGLELGADDYLAKGLAMRDAHRDEPLLSFCMAPHAPYTVGDGTFRRIATLAEELATNPFLRWHDPAIRRNLGMETASDANVFAEIRVTTGVRWMDAGEGDRKQKAVMLEITDNVPGIPAAGPA